MGVPMVLVTLGTDHHPFDRLVAWSERWAAAHPDVRVVVQYGSSRSPIGLEGYGRISHSDLQDLMARADVVVAHGGGGSITQCWEIGKLPIVVARTAALDEHVDDHQVVFADRLAQMGSIVYATSYSEFDAAINEQLLAGADRSPLIDGRRSVETARSIGAMIESLVTVG